MKAEPATIAGSLLAGALDQADLDADDVVVLLDGIPGALDRAQRGRDDAVAGRTLSVDEL